MDAANAEPSVSAVVPLEGRGPLVYEVLHGRPLYVTAVRHVLDVAPDAVVLVSAGQRARVVEDLAAAGLRAPVLDAEQWWASLAAGAARALLVHDPLCPLAPPDLMARVCGQDAGTSVAAVRPVTDTVKVAEAGRITGTIDRQTLAAVASPLLVAAPVLARALAAGDRPPLDDVARLVAWMRERGPVELLTAPAIARRVDDVGAVHLLEAVDELGRQLRLERRAVAVSDAPGSTTPGPA
ncbi:MAG TPA: 2-C-methyl-D-erythritol 4-phosphate cytidylyltransferase [Nocardioides sp.]|nr:2-C-methyl-D-erythritol 4-phosphate cytidylyltransferase [Nocardioides sp.]